MIRNQDFAEDLKYYSVVQPGTRLALTRSIQVPNITFLILNL